MEVVQRASPARMKPLNRCARPVSLRPLRAPAAPDPGTQPVFAPLDPASKARAAGIPHNTQPTVAAARGAPTAARVTSTFQWVVHVSSASTAPARTLPAAT